jgi:hypothetical protein
MGLQRFSEANHREPELSEGENVKYPLRAACGSARARSCMLAVPSTGPPCQTLSDDDGVVPYGAQSLLVSRRPPR